MVNFHALSAGVTTDHLIDGVTRSLTAAATAAASA